METWAAAITGLKEADKVAHVGACLVLARSRDEAIGVAYRIAQKFFPSSQGYDHHRAIVSRGYATPESVVPFSPETT